MAPLAYNLAPLLVRVLFSEAEDPKEFLRRLRKQKDAAPGPKRVVVGPCNEWAEWDDLAEWQQRAASEMETELNDTFKLCSFDHRSITISTSGHQWYCVYENDDAATLAAIDAVREDLENEPGLFTQDWLENFINIERLRDALRADARDDDYWDDSFSDYDAKITELIDRDYLDEDPRIDSEGNELEITPEVERLVDKKWEEMIDSFANNRLEDPIGNYLEEIYGHEDAVKQAIEIAGIDYDAAATNAVNADGWQHFLSRNSGNSYDLPSGAVYVDL